MSARPVIRQLAQLDDFASLATNHTHAASAITSGVFSTARLATGTPDGTKFVRDDGTLAVPPGGLSQATADTLYTALAPATAARNTLQASANVPAVTLKAPAAAGATDYISQSVIDRSNNELARFVLPANPIGGRDTGPGMFARLDFPYTGTGQGPLSVVATNSIFTSTPDPIISLGYNWKPGGVGVAPTETAAAFVVEGKYNFGAKTISEFYLEWYPPSGGGSAIRPFFASIDHGGANLEAKLEEMQLRASNWVFYGAAGDTETAYFKLLPGGCELLQAAGLDGIFKLHAAASRVSMLSLGCDGTADVFRVATEGINQSVVSVGNPPVTAMKFFKAGAGVAVCIGGGDNNSALTIINNAFGGGGDILNLQNVSSVTKFSFDTAGLPRWNEAGNQQTTVGAAGAAAPLPALPTKYLKVKDSAGTTLVVPAYAAS